MRITGGAFRSRELRAPRGAATRPTSDRVREALFSVLHSAGYLPATQVLDLYAGTGALAFEALSRGTERAVLVEHGREALAAIRANAAALGVQDHVEIHPARVERALTELARRSPAPSFDVVFLDPPYADVRTEGFSAVLRDAAVLVSDDGALLLEHASKDAPPPPPAGLSLDRSRVYGDTTLTLYRKDAPAAALE